MYQLDLLIQKFQQVQLILYLQLYLVDLCHRQDQLVLCHRVYQVDQMVLFVPKDKKRALLGELLNDKDMARVLIFTRTKHGANRVARHLHDRGIHSDAIHGNKAQNARQRALDGFRSGRIRALVATDIAARGIDVEGKRADLGLELGRELHHVAHERVLHEKMGEKHMPNPQKLVLLALTVARLLHTHK